MEYSAGMIQIAQPFYAIYLLTIAAEKSSIAEVNEWIDENPENSITDKGIILALMGLRNFTKYFVEYLFISLLFRGKTFSEENVSLLII